MALNFPLSPEDGDTYENYVYDATEGVWNANPQQLASRFITSATQPSTPSNGDGWLDTNTGKTYIYYNDGTSAQWIESGNPVIGFVDPYDQTTTSTGYLALPKGTTAQRPVAPSNGDIRFNTEAGEPEWYSSSESKWVFFRQSPVIEFNLEYLIVAGGGGGSGNTVNGNGRGGGGAGGYRSSIFGDTSGGGASAESSLTLTGGTYAVTVGAGGAGGGNAENGVNGNNSIFGPVTSLGGGGGGFSGTAPSGGSGGGAPTAGSPGSGETGQGFNGGASVSDPTYQGGGGGGAGEVGGFDGQGQGGDGISSSVTGSAFARGGGGGAGRYMSSGSGTVAGGDGGGGTGGAGTTSGTSGITNTGGGGGGAGATNTSVASSGSGGSGIVIIKYLSSITATPSVGLESTTSTSGDFKVTQFTAGTGTVTFS